MPTPFSVSFQQKTHDILTGSLLPRTVTPKICQKERTNVVVDGQILILKDVVTSGKKFGCWKVFELGCS